MTLTDLIAVAFIVWLFREFARDVRGFRRHRAKQNRILRARRRRGYEACDSMGRR